MENNNTRYGETLDKKEGIQGIDSTTKINKDEENETLQLYTKSSFLLMLQLRWLHFKLVRGRKSRGLFQRGPGLNSKKT